MEGEQFSLCWNNFHTNLSSGFHSLLKDEDLVDVTLAAEGKFLKAHKTVLSVCSPFFKELFRVNPCKHPIVILPDVNYAALCSLLHFMYQGEVSVSQEEIPTFIRVAETLKVKGLTDNSSSSSSDTTNGFTSTNRNSYGLTDQKQIIKRPRPVKKIIRPMQPLRPIESPNLVKSPQPQPPPIKKSHIESESTATPPIQSHSSSSTPVPVPTQTITQNMEFQEPLLKPKEEPVDHNEEETNSQAGTDDMNMDIANMLDTTLNEPSPSHQFPNWPSPEMTKMMSSQDTSSPGCGPIVIRSGKGQLVLIHKGHIYTYCDRRENLKLWVCVKKKKLNCGGYITTMRESILISYSEHNHPQLDDVIKRLQVTGSSSSSPELKL